jgi:hypothetical protein
MFCYDCKKKTSSHVLDASPASALHVESRSLVLANARIRFATSSARSCLLAAARKATRVLPRRRKYLVLGRVAWIGHTKKSTRL